MSALRSRKLYCCVYGCLNTTITSELTFFRLPTETSRRFKWLKLIAREDVMNKPSSSYFVCEAHFHQHDILPGSNRKKLKITAQPALCLPSQQQNDVGIQTDIETSTENTDQAVELTDFSENVNNVQIMFCDMKAESGEPIEDFKIEIEEHHVNMPTPNIAVDNESLDTPRPATPNNNKRKMSTEYEHLPCIKKSIKDIADEEKEVFLDLCDTFLTHDLTTLAKAQAYAIPGNKKAFIDNKDYIALCFELYLTTPQVYAFLQSMLDLPSPNVLKDATPITTKINETVMSVLKTKVYNMTDLEKNCSVAVSTIDLKRQLFYDTKEDKINGFNEVDGEQMMATAKYALVFMVRGIFVNWKQPITYALLSEYPNHTQVEKWIEDVLKKLVEIGFNVRTFVTDYLPEVYVPTKRLKNKSPHKHWRTVTQDKPYFIINNKTIYHIYDSSHLLSEVYETFTQHDFHFGIQVAKFDHINQFYNEDKTKILKLAPKLTKKHIDPQKLNSKNISFSKEVLSNAVATGISTYVNFKVIDESGNDTVDFIRLITLFLKAIDHSTTKDNNKQCLEEMLSFFHSLRVVDPKNGKDVTPNVKFIERFQITVKSILMVLQYLPSEGITALPTRRLNLGIENFLGQVRTKSGETTEPRPRQFITAFREMLYSHIIKPTKSGNCDMNNVIAIVNKLIELFVETDDNAAPDDNEYNSIEIAPYLYKDLDVPVTHSIFYISTFLLEKCLDVHEHCEVLRTYAKPILHNDTSNVKYKTYFHYSSCEKCQLVIVPCDDFVSYVQKLEEKFRTSFEEKHINRKIAASIYQEIKEINISPPPCPCFPIVYLKKLFISMRIFYTMKFMRT